MKVKEIMKITAIIISGIIFWGYWLYFWLVAPLLDKPEPYDPQKDPEFMETYSEFQKAMVYWDYQDGKLQYTEGADPNGKH